MIERLLLVVNREAASGHDPGAVRRLAATLEDVCGPRVAVGSRLAAGHAEVSADVREFLAVSAAPSLIVAGGGGGTLRAVIEAVCAHTAPGPLPGPDRVRIAVLRMGSGNVLARQLGVPRDPQEAVRAVGAAVASGRTVPVSIVRCEFAAPGAPGLARYAATLGGFGQFGRVPADIARWRRRLRPLHALAAAAADIERVTPLQYALVLAVRALWCALVPGTAETVEIRAPARTLRLRLLAGALTTFRLGALPLDPGLRLGDPAFVLHALPLSGRGDALRLAFSPRSAARSALALRVGAGETLELQLVDRADAGFFLDEDPLRFSGRLRLSLAGALAFLPGSGPSGEVGEP